MLQLDELSAGRSGPSRRRAAPFLVLLVGMLSFPAVPHAQTIVDGCGASYTGEGVLAADLVCPGPDAAVVVNDYGTLDLQGFTITANVGVACETHLPCTVTSTVGVGHIVATPGGACGVTQRGDGGVVVENVTVSGFWSGLYDTLAPANPLTVRDAEITGTTYAGILWIGDVRIDRTRVQNNAGSGVDGAHPLTLLDSDVSLNGGDGVSAGRIDMQRSTVNDNGGNGLRLGGGKIASSEGSRNGGNGVSGGSGRIAISDSSFDQNGESGLRGFRSVKARSASFSGNTFAGVFQDLNFDGFAYLRARESSAMGNGRYGIVQTPGSLSAPRRLSLRSTTVVGNGTNSDCGLSVVCADLASSILPGLRAESSCESSYVHGSGLPGDSWGVCSNE